MPTFSIPTRWGDMDAQRHVNNATFVEYLQEARTDLLLSGPNAHLLGSGIVVASNSIEYRRPVVHGEPLEADVVVDTLGAARFSLATTLRVGDEIAAVARTVLCPLDLATGRIQRLSAAEREWFETVRGSVEPLRTLPTVALGDEPAHTMPLRVRWGDVDSYGHVNNVRAYDYVQEARVALLTELDPRALDNVDAQWFVVRQDVAHLAQLHFRPEPYAVRTRVVRWGETSMTLACEVTDGETVFHRAQTVVVCVDRQGRPRPIDRALIERAGPWAA